MTSATRESIGVTPLKAVMNVLGGWPIISDSFEEKLFDWTEALSTLVAKFGSIAVFSLINDGVVAEGKQWLVVS